MKHKNTHERTRKAIQHISGWIAAISFFLVLGKAGASDIGAPWSEIFPSAFIYAAIGIVAFYVWDYVGGNTADYNRNSKGREKR